MKKIKSALVAVLAAAMLVAMLGCFAGCGPTPSGTFYTLQEAYEGGLLTREELMSIAYYHNGGRQYNEEIMSEEYTPIPKEPAELSEETSLQIRNTAAWEYRESGHESLSEAVADDFTITEYCGTYGDCVVIMITDIGLTGKPGVADMAVTIEGLSFHYNSGNILKVWKEGK